MQCVQRYILTGEGERAQRLFLVNAFGPNYSISGGN